MKKNRWILFGLMFALASPVWAGYPDAPGFEHTGYTHDPQLRELSGLAASRRHPDVYWTHNDSGNGAELFAVRTDGTVIARVQVRGAEPFDWEDMASWVDDKGQSWLAIGDIGDNFSIRRQVMVYLLPEPALEQREVQVAQTLHIRYADGPRDAESLAVDWPRRQLLILDKGQQPAKLYAVPLTLGETVAQPVATLPLLFPLPPSLVPPLTQNQRGAAVAMDLTADGRQLAVLTYRHVYFFDRREGENWQTAVQRHDRWRTLPRMPAFEALAWDAAGQNVLICNEGAWVHYYRAAPLTKPSDTPVPAGSSAAGSTPPAPAHRPTVPAP